MAKSNGIANTIRCPACNKLGAAALNNLCKRCYMKMPPCTIASCDKPRLMLRGRPSRYCERHHYGLYQDLIRDSFDQPANNPLHGYRQADSNDFGLETDEFPIAG